MIRVLNCKMFVVSYEKKVDDRSSHHKTDCRAAEEFTGTAVTLHTTVLTRNHR